MYVRYKEMIQVTLRRLYAVIAAVCIAGTSLFLINDKLGSINEENQVALMAEVESSEEDIETKPLIMTAEYDEKTQGENTYIDMDYVNLNTKILSSKYELTNEEEVQEHDEQDGHDHEVSRGGDVERIKDGEYLDWWKQVRKIIDKDAVLTVKDLDTQKVFKVKYTYGTNHIDSEPLTVEDSKVIKEIWGGSYSWDRRAVQIYYEDKVIAASMVSYPHAGLDDRQANTYVSNRSGGFGKGTNLDKVKDNGVNGVMCIHFKNSTLHKTGRSDKNHQQEVKRAAGIID